MKTVYSRLQFFISTLCVEVFYIKILSLVCEYFVIDLHNLLEFNLF